MRWASVAPLPRPTLLQRPALLGGSADALSQTVFCLYKNRPTHQVRLDAVLQECREANPPPLASRRYNRSAYRPEDRSMSRQTIPCSVTALIVAAGLALPAAPGQEAQTVTEANTAFALD